MNSYLTERIAAQRQTELRDAATHRAGHRQARQARKSRSASFRPGKRSHPVRRRAGYALISIGLRLAYAAGED